MVTLKTDYFMYLHKETLGCDQNIEYFSKVTVLCHTGVHIITSYLSFNVASWLVLLYIMLQAFWFTAVPTPAVSFSIIGMDITKQTKLKSQWVYFHMLAVQLFDSSLTAFKWVPNSIMFGFASSNKILNWSQIKSNFSSRRQWPKLEVWLHAER